MGGKNNTNGITKIGPYLSTNFHKKIKVFHCNIIIEKNIINKPKPINGEHVGPSNHPSGHVIYNAGYGIKSTVPMQALSPNRFIILNDEEPVAQYIDITAVDSQEHVGQHDMVLETPLEGQPAAT